MEYEFEGSNILSMMHNTIRFVGGNNFILTTLSDYSADESNYVIGLHSTYILMSFIFVLWFFIVILIRFAGCRVPFHEHKYLSVIIVAAVISTFFGWMFSLISTVSIQNSLKSLDTISNNTLTSYSSMESLLEIVQTRFILIKTSNLMANNECASAIRNIVDFVGTEYSNYPYLEAETKLQVLETMMESLYDFIHQFSIQQKQINEKLNDVYINWSTLYYTFSTITILMNICLLSVISFTGNSHSFNDEQSHIWIHRFLFLLYYVISS
jgi:hypothetical protein